MSEDVVGPLAARLVRQDRAAQAVFPMFDALPATERTSLPRPSGGPARAVEPDAYAQPSAGLYVYRLSRDGVHHVAVVAAVRVDAFVDGRVRGHEEVQPDRVEALVTHFESTEERSELVALLHRPGPVFARVLAESVQREPLLALEGPEEWQQSVWRVADDDVAALTEELSEAVHYIADGHHRVAASLGVWRRAGKPEGSAVMCALYPLDGLRLLAFHRRVVGPLDIAQLFRLLVASGHFEVTDLDDPEMSSGAFAVYVDGAWHDVAFTGERAPGVAGLDVDLLDEHVLSELVGSGAQVEVTSALTPIEELVAACDADGGALFALRPPSLDRLTEVADRGEVMPPKTTYFDPKPYAGIFVS